MPHPDEAFREFTDVLISLLPLVGSTALDLSTKLVDLGLDSLNTVEILLRLEETFDIELPDDELTVDTFATVGSLWSLVSSSMPTVAGR